ncbi:MAG: CCA tRNA nucleotidyltransferase [Pedosphaera sp.]|nr:CCA tRNA nucleotidyltransferase [Pedosphaera sp.]
MRDEARVKSSPRELATGIVRRLQAAGFAAYWVGGCVRDFLLGREPGDYDIATDAVPEQIEKLFPHTIAVGRKFGVMVVVEAKQQFQVATFRAESDYRDGRRPETVSFGDARADALRRDFTINGLFFDPVAGKSHDWVGGEADLRAGIIRTIGAPEERFAEDHLRMLRAVRFAARLGFEIQTQTFAAVKTHAAKIKLISAERIRDELNKLFAPPFGVPPSGGSPLPPSGPPEGGTPNAPAARGLELLRASGLLEHILPELAATVTCEQSPDYHPEGNVFTHLRLMLEKMPPDSDPLLPWAVLMHDIAKPLTASRDEQSGSIHFYEHEKIGARMAEEILERLRFPRKQIEQVSETVLHHMQFKDAPNMRKSTLRRMLLRETFPLELQLHRLDCLGSHGKLDVYDFLVAQSAELAQQPEIRPPLLTGAELIELGVKPRPAMGKLLAEIREKQLADELKTKAAARAWVKAKMAEASGN